MMELFGVKLQLNKEALAVMVLLWYLYNLMVAGSSIGFVVLGFVMVFLVPGYCWVDSLVKAEDQLERFVLAVALSVSIVILSIVWMNLVFKIPITRVGVFADIALISIAGMLWEHRDIFGMKVARPVSVVEEVKKNIKKSKKK